MTNTPNPGQPSPSHPTSRGSILRRWWFWVLVAALAAGGGYTLWSKKQAQQEQMAAMGGPGGRPGPGGPGGRRPGAGAFAAPAMPVGVAVARVQNVDVFLNGLGAVTPTATATVRARVDGQLMKLYYKEGQVVKAGDLLAEIDPRALQAALTQAEGQLARDRALLASARLDLKRYQTLLSQDSIASQQVDTQSALVKQYEGTVTADEGNVASARLQLSFTRVTAPISGRLGLRQADIGNNVTTSDTNGLVIITQLQPITAIFSIPEDNIPQVLQQLQSGRKLPAQAWDREQKNKLADGVLLTIDNQVDATTGTVKLKAQFPNTDYALFPSQFVNIRLQLKTDEGATVIPTAAIQRGSKGLFVYVVKQDNTVTVRPVKTGTVQDDLSVITDGVKPGETVVIDGIDRLREGAKVEAVTRGGADDPANKLATENPDARRHGKRGQGGQAGEAGQGGMSPEERQKRWAEINKRIDAGEFGEEIKKLPEDQRRQKMMELRRQREAGANANSGNSGNNANGAK
ncbi:MdtA/MuxA family multidrug efflux RND transporter periplasmic adaptor subunit [Herbaspirillum rubrisubalbicans]|uniref:Multidrug transporter subunit MdtA n=1 Tax=Herbaspirillum rubrisubalbicans Os34 TaxID=1235827 RepID=A0A6M3ZNY1_9BURK|nr:MdtA/MuxA family multidrug efflux RND transporter periplasmic adaptor subunit [Herbaspirillum rubrisubalbicans]MCP1576934.1 multidrug efflux system membrane fusion protein [Herbaspirillum rubrisubalbicans]QJQ00141.1 multidrug transporter subunit MdtA [Herbaspirillum rubrisubalbicans Os34]